MTTSPGATPPRRGRRLPLGAPVLLSGAATLISVVALVVALAALARGSEAPAGATEPVGAETAAPATSSPADAPTGTPEEPAPDPTEDPGGLDQPSGEAPLPSGGAPYTVFKEDVRVTLAGGTSVTRRVDLDQPLVNADDTRTDLTFSTYYDPPRLEFTNTDVAEGRSADVTPDECASDIQLSPTDQEVELSQDLVLCAVTNGVGAVNEPSRPKLARIVVNSVNRDGTTSLTITTWEIPR